MIEWTESLLIYMLYLVIYFPNPRLLCYRHSHSSTSFIYL